MLAECPTCGEILSLCSAGLQVHRLVRCAQCSDWLRISAIDPVKLAVFQSHGLAFVNGQVTAIWSRVSAAQIP